MARMKGRTALVVLAATFAIACSSGGSGGSRSGAAGNVGAGGGAAGTETGGESAGAAGGAIAGGGASSGASGAAGAGGSGGAAGAAGMAGSGVAGTGSGGGTAGAGQGGAAGAATCPTANEEKFSFFVVSNKALIREGGADVSGMFSKLGGNLGGIKGADAICQHVAELVSPCQRDKVWHAFLSTTTEDAIDRVGKGPWYDRAGRLG